MKSQRPTGRVTISRPDITTEIRLIADGQNRTPAETLYLIIKLGLAAYRLTGSLGGSRDLLRQWAEGRSRKGPVTSAEELFAALEEATSAAETHAGEARRLLQKAGERCQEWANTRAAARLLTSLNGSKVIEGKFARETS